MKRLFIAGAALAVLPLPAFAGCNSWDYTPWECGYVREMHNRLVDIEDRQRRLEERQRGMERQADDALYGQHRPY